MVTVMVVLVVLALVAALVAAAGKLPLWLAVVILCVVELIRVLPITR